MSAAAPSLIVRRKPSEPGEHRRPEAPLRLPEDRAFDVDTINTRLARMAERAAPRRRLSS